MNLVFQSLRVQTPSYAQARSERTNNRRTYGSKERPQDVLIVWGRISSNMRSTITLAVVTIRLIMDLLRLTQCGSEVISSHWAGVYITIRACKEQKCRCSQTFVRNCVYTGMRVKRISAGPHINGRSLVNIAGVWKNNTIHCMRPTQYDYIFFLSSTIKNINNKRELSFYRNIGYKCFWVSMWVSEKHAHMLPESYFLSMCVFFCSRG